MSDEVISIDEAIGDFERKIQQLGEEKTRYAQNHPTRVELESQIQIYHGVIRELRNKKAAIQSKAIQTERWGEVRSLCAQGEYAEAMSLIGRRHHVDGGWVRLIHQHRHEMEQYVESIARKQQGAYGPCGDFDVLVGQAFDEVVLCEDTDDPLFIRGGKAIYTMLHEQKCCESVYLNEVIGDLAVLSGEPIVSCEQSWSCHELIDATDDWLDWCFYKVNTAAGSVVFWWIASGDGCMTDNSVEIKEVE